MKNPSPPSYEIEIAAVLGLILLLEPDIRPLVTVMPRTPAYPPSHDHFLRHENIFINLPVVPLILYSPALTSSLVPLPKIHVEPPPFPQCFLVSQKHPQAHTPFAYPRLRDTALSPMKGTTS